MTTPVVVEFPSSRARDVGEMRTGEACGGARVATFDKEPACALVDVADGAASAPRMRQTSGAQLPAWAAAALSGVAPALNASEAMGQMPEWVAQQAQEQSARQARRSLDRIR